MKTLFGADRISEFRPASISILPEACPRAFACTTAARHDLVFVGPWTGFRTLTAPVSSLLKLCRSSGASAACSLVLAGRSPVAEILAFAQNDPLIQSPARFPTFVLMLWDALVSIVPLRIGGGTRLKIYEAMAPACRWSLTVGVRA